MMEKNGKMEPGKTPSEDRPDKISRRMVMGTPVYDKLPEENNFEKISFIVHTMPEIKKGDTQGKIFSDEDGPTS